jgi:hypothetical protein
MQYLLVPALVLLTFCASAFSQETPFSVPRVDTAGKTASAEGAFLNPLPDPNPFREFRARLGSAVEARDMTALQALYQTNGVTPEQLDKELSRWRPMLEPDDKSRVSIQSHGTIFRDFKLSNPMWKRLAARLTSHTSTHLVELSTSKGYWMLPLVEVEGRLFLVPSDKSTDMGLRREDVQPDRAPNETQPVPSNTNSTSDAAGSRR